MKKLLLTSFAAAFMLQANAQTFTHTPVVITGLNADVIADGPGAAVTSTSTDVDGENFNFVAQNFVNPTNQSPTSYLPTGGLINSFATPGLPFQLASYSGNNSLRLTTTANTGTLTFATPRAADKLNILATTAYTGTFTATVNFTDATTQVFAGNAVPNWFDGTVPNGVKGVSRVGRLSDLIENNTNNPRMYQYVLALSPANTSKNIQSITFTKTTTGVKEVLHIFAITASALLPNDIGISTISSPISPVVPNASQPVTVSVINYGSSPLSSATIGWSVNNALQPDFAFTASPAIATTAVSSPVTLGNFSFPAGTHKIKAWTKLPNGVADGATANDTLQVNITACTSLNGSYTINKNSPSSATSFQSFADARQTLNSCGVSGPVTFTVAANSGPYNEQIILTAITGSSATNTITFEGNGNTVSASPGTTHQGVFTLDGADFININNFTLALNPTAATGFGFQLKNTADNLTITNNTINLPLTSSLSTVAGIIAGTSGTAAGNNTSNSVIQNNIINGGYYGISINGTTGNVGAVGNQIKNNQVKDPYLTGIYLNNVTNAIIESNDISRSVRTNGNAFNGIYLVGTSINNQIRKNKVHNTHDVATSKTGTVQCFYTQSPGGVGSENIFSNNLAYNLNNGGGTVYVFSSNGATNTWYLYNTISADNPAISFSTLRGIYFISAVTNVKFINNNFSLASPATNKHGIYLSGIIISDRNNLYVGNTANSFVGYFGSNKATLADWKLVSSGAFDQNSVSANPFFINPATGNLQPTANALNDIGAPQTAVTDDITGATRNATTPDPGAYEFVPAAAEVGISAVLSPSSGCGLTNQEVVSVTLNNNGTAAQSNIPVSYTINGGTPVPEIFAGPLAPGTSVTYNFTTKADLSNPIIYTIAAQTNLTSDPVVWNDAASKVIDAIPLISTFPYTQNFETNDGGWRVGGTASSWALGTPAKTVINSAASGTKAWVTGLTAAHNNQEKSQVLSPCINLSSLVNPVFEMKAWWNSQFSNDGAVLQSSIDGGTTWQNVGAFGDLNNWYNDNTIAGTPGGQPATSAQGWTGRTSTSNGSNGWVSVKHDLTGLAGQTSVKLRIAFGSDATTTDDGFAFDDVMIYEAPTNDAGVTAIITPNSGCGLTNLETVTITVKNFGSSNLATIPVAFRVDGGALVNETVTGPLAPNATTNYTFIAKADLSAIGTHTIVAKTKVPGDNLAMNDSISKTINAIPVISTLPYTEGFENGNGGWYASGTSSSWALGTPAKPVINTAAAGTKSWVTGLTGPYNSWENSFVVSPCLNFAGKPDPDFEMRVWWNTEFSADGTVLQSSIDGGATWQRVGAMGDPTNWYNDNTLNGSPGGQPFASAQGWSGRNLTSNGSGGWTTVKHRLTGLGGQTSVLLRVAFGADGLTHDDGFAFDEIKIVDNTNNLAVNSIVPLTKLCGFSATEPITALIENAGPTPATGFTVSYTINNGTPVTQTYTGTLASGSSSNFTFSQTANLSAPGNYTIVVTVNMAGDMDASNNSATYTFSNTSFTGLPPVFNFEPAGNGILQFQTVTKTKSAIVEGTGASFGTGTQGMIMDGVDNAGWAVPGGTLNPWTINPNNFSGAYICFNPSGGAATDSLWLTFDLKQLFKGANANTNLRITVNGTQVGPTYRPPFSGTPIVWTPIKVDLTTYKNQSSLQVGIESSVKEAFANGAGTANLIDNIVIKRFLRNVIHGVKADELAHQIHVFPNPSNGQFNIDLPKGKTYELEVTDLTGKLLMKQTTKGGSNQINLDNSAKGIYLLKISGENGSAFRKLIVE